MCEIVAKIILSDIEGTTTSISFVKDVLFPYAKENTLKYLQKNWSTKEIQDNNQKLINLKEYESYIKENLISQCEDQTPESISKFVNYLIDKDLKLAPLKLLQGWVWCEGYKNGILKGHLYPDVPNAFKKWKEAGLQIAIYSSGSITAQQLLFGQSVYGDLLPYINQHFDTTTSGHKQEIESYRNIAKDLDVKAKDILFLTDVVKEAEAARSAGMQVVLLNRPGNATLTDSDKLEFIVIDSFQFLNIKV